MGMGFAMLCGQELFDTFCGNWSAVLYRVLCHATLTFCKDTNMASIWSKIRINPQALYSPPFQMGDKKETVQTQSSEETQYHYVFVLRGARTASTILVKSFGTIHIFAINWSLSSPPPRQCWVFFLFNPSTICQHCLGGQGEENVIMNLKFKNLCLWVVFCKVS